MSIYTIPINHFSAIAINGIDATTFLQGQLICDVHNLTKTLGIFSACCDSKGRIISNFYIFQQGQNYYLLLPKLMVPFTLGHLKKYSVFYKVELTSVDDITPLKTGIKINKINENTWHQLNIEIGLVWIYPQTTSKLIPQMINLHKLESALSLKKGCYIGQEVIARTHYLGKLKRHLYRANVLSQNLPTPGDELKDLSNHKVGLIVEVALKGNKEYQILAVILDTSISKGIFLNQVELKNVVAVKEPISKVF